VRWFLLHRKYAAIFRCFVVRCRWTPRDELYGIVDQSIDPGLALHEPIGIPELSTLNLKMCMIPIVYSTDCFYVPRRHKFLYVLANYSLGFWGWNDFCFATKMWWCFDVLFGAWVDTSWRAVWHCRLIDRSRSWSARSNWHYRVVHPWSRSVHDPHYL
jgi:hypothetical protein